MESKVDMLSQEKDQWKSRYEYTLEALRVAIHKRFGRKSEKFIYDDNQLSMLLIDEEEELFESEENQELSSSEEDILVKPYRRKKPRKAIPDDIPEVTIYHDIKEEDKHCACGTQKKIVKTIKTKKMGYLPEQHYAENHLRLVYGCKNCEGSGDEEKPALLAAPKEKAIIPKSIATPSLLAGIFTNKYCDHLPYYRQSQRFSRNNIHISRQDMSNWQQKVYNPAIKPLVELMKTQILNHDFMQMDETTMRVMNEP